MCAVHIMQLYDQQLCVQHTNEQSEKYALYRKIQMKTH